ncbi:unnamed protein product [Bubo scandiacus]
MAAAWLSKPPARFVLEEIEKGQTSQTTGSSQKTEGSQVTPQMSPACFTALKVQVGKNKAREDVVNTPVLWRPPSPSRDSCARSRQLAQEYPWGGGAFRLR